mmetsp:Transcript_27171/g.61655  ORF Transcript_27171/g.61655 Transcript_27171/m.61655 type:complete len:237 (+) Transcript_27171:44-754(+)
MFPSCFPNDARPGAAFSRLSCICCPASLILLCTTARAVGGSSLTFVGMVRLYCIFRTSGSHVILSSVIVVLCFMSWKSVPSIENCALLRSFMSATVMEQILVTFLSYWVRSGLRPSTKSVESSTVPTASCSNTLNLTERSPTKRNLQLHGPPSCDVMLGAALGVVESPSSHALSQSKSAAADSTRGLPSTVSVMTLPVLYFFSSATVCSANGPISNFHAIFVFSGSQEMDRGSEVR